MAQRRVEMPAAVPAATEAPAAAAKTEEVAPAMARSRATPSEDPLIRLLGGGDRSKEDGRIMTYLNNLELEQKRSKKTVSIERLVRVSVVWRRSVNVCVCFGSVSECVCGGGGGGGGLGGARRA